MEAFALDVVANLVALSVVWLLIQLGVVSIWVADD